MILFLRHYVLFALLVISHSLLIAQENNEQACKKGQSTLYSLDLFSKPDQSIASIEGILPILLEEKCWKIYADCFNGLSAAYYYKRDYKKARENAQKAYDISKKYCKKSSVYGASIANLASFVDESRSIELQLESLKLEEDLGSSSLVIAQAMESLGLSYQKNGDFDTAINYFKLAIEHANSHLKKENHYEARILRQLAKVYESKNDYSTALPLLKKSDMILTRLPEDKYFKQTKWYLLVEMANIHLLLDEKDMALKYITKAIDLQKNDKLLEEYKSWLSIGDIYCDKEDFKKALAYYKRAMEEGQNEFSDYKYHEALALPYAATAKVYSKKKRYDESLEYYSKAMEYIAIDFKPKDLLQNPTLPQLINQFEALTIIEGKLSTLMSLYNHNNELSVLQSAHHTSKLTAELIQSIRQGYLAKNSKHSLLDRVNPFYENAVEIAFKMHQATGEEKYLEDAFFFTESNKAVVLYEVIKNRDAQKNASIPDSFLIEEKKLRSELSFYETNILEEKSKKIAPRKEVVKAWEQTVFKLKKAIQDVVQKMEKDYPLYDALKQQTEPITLKQLQKSLSNEKTAIVEFMIGSRNSYAFFMTKDKLRVHSLPTKEHLSKAIAEIRSVITTAPQSDEQYKSDYRFFTKNASTLYDNLLADGLSELSNQIKHLVIIPDDILNNLPFELLLTKNPDSSNFNFSPKNLEYLFEQFEISYNYSATFFDTKARQKISTSNKKPFVGLAPNFKEVTSTESRTCSEGELYELFCNKKEVSEINKLLNGDTYLDSTASKHTFEREVAKANIMHLATHACINETESDLNRVFFSKNESITQRELSNLDAEAELTVLSACNTGSGELVKGEGVMSLARCFMMAGSKSVLTSLWSVDDCATTTIMLFYYKNLRKGLSKDVALSTAKKDYLKGADLSSSHPYYWAAFVQFGSVEGIGKTSFGYLNIFFVCGIALVVLFGFWRFGYGR